MYKKYYPRNSKIFIGIFCPFVFCSLQVMPASICGADVVNVSAIDKVEINQEEIRLGEIAAIKGEDQGLVQKLSSVFIGKSPLPGKTFHVDEDYIKIRLKQSGIDLSQIALQVPEGIEVTRGFVEVSKQKIAQIVLDYLHKKIPWQKDKVRLKNIRISQQVILPKGEISYRVTSPKNTDYLGATSLSVYFDVNKQFEKRVWATVTIEVLTDVVVTTRPLRRNRSIRREDIRLRRKDLAGLPSDVITRLEDVLGKRTKRMINANVVLRPDLIEFPPLVNRGDRVVIIAESDALRITALGEAKERGRKGDRIRVLNIDSQKAVYARIMDANTVAVDF